MYNLHNHEQKLCLYPQHSSGACRVFKALIASGKMQLGSSLRIINPCQAVTSFTLHPIGRSRRKGLV